MRQSRLLRIAGPSILDLENSLPKLENLAVEFRVTHELLEILVIQFVEQLLGILRVEPEDLVTSNTGEGLTNLTTVSMILNLHNHPAFGIQCGLSDAALGIHTDIDKLTGNAYICSDCFIDDGCVPPFPFEIVGEGLCRGLAEGAVGQAEVTLPAP